MDDSLRTLAAPCSHAVEIRKSRFLARAAPATDVASALAFVQSAHDATANHDCWAWRIGQDYRFNDDGEPSGSAGKPILQAIDGQRMDRVVVVVTRWFGGIKLGVGGLIRAYGGSAAECLRGGEAVPIVAMARLAFDCDFAELPLLKARMQPWQVEIEDTDYNATGVHVVLSLPQRHVADLRRLLADVTHGRSDLRPPPDAA